jgi:copper chaperone
MNKESGMSTHTYIVNGMTCGHCVKAVTHELCAVHGVTAVDVNLETKKVVVTGSHLSDAALRAAIDEAGYEPEP